MTSKDIKYLFRNVKRYQENVKILREKIEILKAQAEKITPQYGGEGGGAPGSSSKVENNVIKYAQLTSDLQAYEILIEQAEKYLQRLKIYQRQMVVACLVNHVSYSEVAKSENTTSHNVKKICDNAIKTLVS